MKDTRIELKFRNNFILERMEQEGIKNVSQLARLSGAQQSALGSVINFKISPMCHVKPGKSGFVGTMRWRRCVEQIAVTLKCAPESLFSEESVDRIVDEHRKVLKLDSHEVQLALQAVEQQALPPDERLDEKEKKRALLRAIETLTPREQMVIRMRFDLEEETPQLLEEIGDQFKVTRNRILQIESKALRKLRHPARQAIIRGETNEFASRERCDGEL